MSIYTKAIRALRPKAEWVLRGDTYEGLEWLDESYAKPTEQEIESQLVTFVKLQIVQDLSSAVQFYLDERAKEKNFDGILSACSYANSKNPLFAVDGAACSIWRDAVWTYCYQVLSDVEANKRDAPTVDQLLAELPAFSWPE